MQIALCVALALAAAATAVAQEYPLRPKYPQTTPISTRQVAQAFDGSLVVDVRSRFEFEVMHIDGAVHIDLSDPTFLDRLARAVGGDKSKGVITYCNGTTCDKSYDAAVAAQGAGFTNVRVYDGGIFEWARLARGRTLLFGKPIQGEGIIPESRYRAHLAVPGAFERGAAGADALLIDVRDALQRQETAAFAQKAEWITLDQLVKQLATPAFRNRAQGKTLYIFDNVGKQVRWLQYALEAQGYTRYYFLAHGMEGLVGHR
jgi:rhodanese-related sulfurtransferase